MSVRTCASRLARIEKTVAARCPAGPDRPILVEVAVDEAGVGRLRSVAGPYRGCVCCGWPEDAYEPFAGNRAELHDYYARHGWQPDRTSCSSLMVVRRSFTRRPASRRGPERHAGRRRRVGDSPPVQRLLVPHRFYSDIRRCFCSGIDLSPGREGGPKIRRHHLDPRPSIATLRRIKGSAQTLPSAAGTTW